MSEMFGPWPSAHTPNVTGGGGGGPVTSGTDTIGPMFGQNAKYTDPDDLTFKALVSTDFDSEEWTADPALLVAHDLDSEEWTADPSLLVAHDLDSEEWAADPALLVADRGSVDFTQYATVAIWIDQANPTTSHAGATVLNAKQTVPLANNARKIVLLYDLTGYPNVSGTRTVVASGSGPFGYFQTTGTLTENAPMQVFYSNDATAPSQPFTDTATWNSLSGATSFAGYTSAGTSTFVAPASTSGYAIDAVALSELGSFNRYPGRWMIVVITGADATGLNTINMRGPAHGTASERPQAIWDTVEMS